MKFYSVRGPHLFAYLCEKGDYLEEDVRLYFRQLMSALAWLHRKDLVHLDIKVSLHYNNLSFVIFVVF